jgi:hypothetical protein
MTSVSEKERSGRKVRAERCWKADDADWAIADKEEWAKKGESLRDLLLREEDSVAIRCER